MKDKRHIILVFSLVFLFALSFIIITKLLTPDSFDEHGHYRWDALGEIESQSVTIMNTETCLQCHKDIYLLHEKDAHYNVPCVDCHGDARLHVDFHKSNINSSKKTPANARIPKEYDLEGCLFCHRKLKARPTDFPQIDKDNHYKFLNIIDTTTKCIECHNPHEPIFLLTEARKARLHPIVYKCTDCHDIKPEKDFHDVKDHPVIFECRDCHAEFVASFESKPHNNYVECRTCHLFHKENESVGRIYKNGNAAFCLLCHQNKPFKNPDYPPKINWPSHIGQTDFIRNFDQKICLNCHQNQIHDMELKENINPHPVNWKKKHRPFLMKNFNKKFTNEKCGDCHQNNFCFSCHQVKIPHNPEFSMNHKDAVMKKGMQTCTNCHEKVQCTYCHDMPQLDNFKK